MPALIPSNPDALGTSSYFVTYAGAIAAHDLVAEGLAPCRRIRANVAGTVVVKRAHDKASVTLNFLAGETQDVSATDIVSGTATDLTVFW